VLGGLMGAQLSVVHVLTFVQALRTEFGWETFLLDPVIFITWSWVAVALLFWGRVYCGWLCPFGALQEVLNKLARRLGVRQISVPFMLHERLWPIKYIIFLGLFAVSLASMTMAFRAAETEPFKTVVTLRFMREWPFVTYALALLAAGLFVERFYCRYLCPLGAALAIPARLRMFEWLKRRPQCGRECRICSVKCPVQAIHPEGQINPNECIYCLNCQTLYYNEHICPPLKARAARRPMSTPAPSGEAAKS
jgi:polyferredoxin